MFATYPGLDQTDQLQAPRELLGEAHGSLSTESRCLPCFSLSLLQIQKRVPHHEIRPNSHDTSNQIPQDGGRV